MPQQYRSTEITENEKQAAKQTINAFDELISRLKNAHNRDLEVVNVLKSNKDASPNDLFKIRHLLRRFQTEVRERYSDIIIAFSGKKDSNMEGITEGYIHKFRLLEKDTTIRGIKSLIQDSMQQLTEFVEKFLESFEHFNNQDQIQEIILASQKSEEVIGSLENIIEKQMKPYFQKNILKNRLSNLRTQIYKRAFLIKILGDL